MTNHQIILTECPRDAMQGWARHIPAAEKAQYLNSLLKVGFDVLDFGSFVSPKAIPQLADTAEVLSMLDVKETKTKLLAIVANTRGAEDAARFAEISWLGFPFSISETFQLRNTNKTIAQSLDQVKEIQELCARSGKKLLIYISMGFGNPYGDPYNADVAIKWVSELSKLGITDFAMSDTVGVATPENISYIFSSLLPAFPDAHIGAHFHSSPDKWEEKIAAAWQAGCRRFDAAMKGIGGCPMAEDDLVGNIATESIVDWCNANQIGLNIDTEAFHTAWLQASDLFSH